MADILALWLPILLSAVAVFFISFLCWMVLPHHRGDWKKLPEEDQLMDNIRGQSAAPGQYMFPHCGSPDQMKDPAYVKKVEAGPNGMLIIKPQDSLHMGKAMAISFLYNLIIAIFVAYIVSFAATATSDRMTMFRLAGTVSFLGNAGALGWNPIWFGRTWGSTSREIFDGLLYGLATGAIFAYLA